MRALSSKSAAVLIGVFCVALATQFSFWLLAEYADEDAWAADVAGLAHGTVPDFADLVLVHPGTAILSPAALFTLAGATPLIALNMTIALIISCAITATCALCIVLRPASLWWLGAAILLIADPLYGMATAPSAVAGMLVPPIVLLALYLREHARDSWKILSLIGIFSGILLATRIDTGLLVSFFTFIYLVYLVRERVWIFFVTAAAVFFLLDPYLWIFPLEHVRGILSLIHDNATLTKSGYGGYTVSTLSLASVALALALISSFRANLTSIPRDYIWYLSLMFITACALIMSASYHPMRYFFPFTTAWEVMLPILVLDIFERVPRGSMNIPLHPAYVLFAALALSRALPIYILLT